MRLICSSNKCKLILLTSYTTIEGSIGTYNTLYERTLADTLDNHKYPATKELIVF